MGMGVLLYEIILSLAAIPFAGLMKYSIYSIELGILVGTVLVTGMVIDMGISTEDSLYILCLEKQPYSLLLQYFGTVDT